MPMTVQLDARVQQGPGCTKDKRGRKCILETVSPHLLDYSVHGLGHRRRLIGKARDLSESKTRPARCFARCFVQDPGWKQRVSGKIA